MLYDLIRTFRGKETIVMTDQLSKVNDRMKTLRSSQNNGIRGQKVAYSVRESVEREKYKLKPNRWDASGKDCNPKRVK